MSCYIHAYGACCALGHTCEDMAVNLQAGKAPGMQPDTSLLQSGELIYTGKVTGKLPAIPASLHEHASRNNQLLLQAFAQVRASYDRLCAGLDPERIGVVLGTSTSGLSEADTLVSSVCAGQGVPPAYHYAQQELGDPSVFMSAYLQVTGPAFTVSTACSSSLRAIISACRLLESGLCDAVVCGGADCLCRMPVNGFHAMGLMATGERCQPFCEGRKGISIGEGAAVLLLTREPSALKIAGLGESSDAYHISSPHPQGAGARAAMQQALAMAGIACTDLSYINLHGTGTPMNDTVEARLMHDMAPDVPCSSTKWLTGHTLGACGAVETALLCLLVQRHLPLPWQDFTQRPKDSSLPEVHFVQQGEQRPVHYLMNNAFAFGGNNASVILEYLS